jgi:hypothetical protein
MPGPEVGEAPLYEELASRLEASGAKGRLRATLRERLVECGWWEEVSRQCQAFIRERGERSGDPLTTREIVGGVFPEASVAVPDHIKAEILAALRQAILEDRPSQA